MPLGNINQLPTDLYKDSIGLYKLKMEQPFNLNRQESFVIVSVMGVQAPVFGRQPERADRCLEAGAGR